MNRLLAYSTPRSWPAAWYAWVRQLSERRLLLTLCLALIALFMACRCTDVGDSKYTLAVSETLLHRGTMHLDEYYDSEKTPDVWPMSYHVYQHNGHVDCIFPPGASILSTPFSALFSATGWRVIQNGQHLFRNEKRQQRLVAAILMSMLAAGLFLTARLVFGCPVSIVIVVAACLASQVLSVASRGVWSHTWGILLTGWALYLVCRFEVAEDYPSVRPILLASLLSWAFFTRPTFALSIVGVTIWMILRCRREFFIYAATGAAWFACFVLFSWTVYQTPLPFYFLPGRLSTATLGTALAGNLISPARGVLVYTPIILFATAMAVLYGRRSALRWICAAGGGVIVAHTLAVSGFPHWWAGYSYGPRLMTDLVPWWFVVMLTGLDGRQRTAASPISRRRRMEFGIGFCLLTISLFMNVVRALHHSKANRGASNLGTWTSIRNAFGNGAIRRF